MSDAHHESFEVKQEKDSVPTGSLALVSVVVLAIFAAFVFWADRMLQSGTRTRQPTGVAEIPKLLGSAEIGLVDQLLFADQTTAEEKRKGAQRTLMTYGWVDKEQGTIRIPVERAMQLMIEEARQ